MRKRRNSSFASMQILFVSICLAGPCSQRSWAESDAYKTDVVAYLAEVDDHYPFFDLKNNRGEWEKKKNMLLAAVEECKTDVEFLQLINDSFQALHDGHMGFKRTDVELPRQPARFYPGFSLMPAQGNRVIVMHGGSKHTDDLKPGTIVKTINGVDARSYLETRTEKEWKKSRSSSPQRTRLYEYRIPLRDVRGASYKITIHTADGDKGRQLICETMARGWPHTYNLPDGLKRAGRSCFYAKLPEGPGYIYLRRVDNSVTEGLPQALEEYRDAKGWIVDLRGNGGGGYDAQLVNAVKRMPQPVAVLIDSGTISAGETLARDFRREAKAKLLGQKTAGCSSSKRQWTFPSGIATISMARRSRWRNDRKPIEFNGIEPDIYIEPIPKEVAEGKNSEIERAMEYLINCFTDVHTASEGLLL